jgi:hypothetical protein
LLPLLEEQPEIVAQVHQDARSACAVEISVDQGLHLAGLQANVAPQACNGTREQAQIARSMRHLCEILAWSELAESKTYARTNQEQYASEKPQVKKGKEEK